MLLTERQIDDLRVIETGQVDTLLVDEDAVGRAKHLMNLAEDQGSKVVIVWPEAWAACERASADFGELQRGGVAAILRYGVKFD